MNNQQANRATIAQLSPGKHSFTLDCIIIDIDSVTPKRGNPRSIWVGDPTGSIVFVVFDDSAGLAPGDMLRITNGCSNFHKEQLLLQLDRISGKMVRFGQDLMVFAEYPNLSSCKWKQERDRWLVDEDAPGNLHWFVERSLSKFTSHPEKKMRKG